MKVIADEYGVHYATVSRIVKKAEKQWYFIARPDPVHYQFSCATHIVQLFVSCFFVAPRYP
jgi:hypothetical protein